ncbi:hypothetical protein F4678DRAFT_462296 [Xylaria arbuscula]|nr:hypothetical protein F4678DRAFT_462296 [Xylaria arbuscula]
MKLSQVLLGIAALMITGVSATPIRSETLVRSSSALDGDVLYDKPAAEKRASSLDGDVLYDKPAAEKRASFLEGDVHN